MTVPRLVPSARRVEHAESGFRMTERACATAVDSSPRSGLFEADLKCLPVKWPTFIAFDTSRMSSDEHGHKCQRACFAGTSMSLRGRQRNL